MLKGKLITIGFLIALLVSLSGTYLWQWSVFIAVAVLILFSAVMAYGSMNVDSNFFIKTINQGDTKTNCIAITFDDGPFPENTTRILDILKEKQVESAFFCIGKNVMQSPAVLRRIDEEGHVVGNHTFNHGRFFDLQSSSAMHDELVKTDQIIFNLLGKRTKLFRPPYGVTNPALAKAVRKCSYSTIGWSLRSLDTITKDKHVLWNRITKNLKAGDVVLFHDYCENTIELLPQFIDHAAKNGLKIVRLDVLLNLKPYA